MTNIAIYEVHDMARKTLVKDGFPSRTAAMTHCNDTYSIAYWDTDKDDAADFLTSDGRQFAVEPVRQNNR